MPYPGSFYRWSVLIFWGLRLREKEDETPGKIWISHWLVAIFDQVTGMASDCEILPGTLMKAWLSASHEAETSWLMGSHGAIMFQPKMPGSTWGKGCNTPQKTVVLQNKHILLCLALNVFCLFSELLTHTLLSVSANVAAAFSCAAALIFKLRTGVTGSSRCHTIKYGSKNVKTNQSQKSHLEVPSSAFDLQNPMNSQLVVDMVDKELLRSTRKQMGSNWQLCTCCRMCFLHYAQVGTRIWSFGVAASASAAPMVRANI